MITWSICSSLKPEPDRVGTSSIDNPEDMSSGLSMLRLAGRSGSAHWNGSMHTIYNTTHASFLREPGAGSTSFCKTKYLPPIASAPLGNKTRADIKIYGKHFNHGQSNRRIAHIRWIDVMIITKHRARWKICSVN